MPSSASSGGAMSLKVDLTLAVNYLPACTCLVKMLVFMLGMASVYPGREIDAFVIIAAVLYMDRLVTRNIIFDANAILLAVFFANVHAGIRALSVHRAYQSLMDGMFIFWAMGSVVLISEPQPVKIALERRARMSRIGPVILMLVIQVATSHFNEPLETSGIRTCRAISFTLLAFAWIYIVGVHTTHGIEYLKENSCQFVARLAPVLYVSQWIAVAFTIAAIGGFIMQYMRLQHSFGPDRDLESGLVAVVGSTANLKPPPLPPAATAPHTGTSLVPPSDDGEDLSNASNTEELFRLARMQAAARRAGGPSALDTIIETL